MVITENCALRTTDVDDANEFARLHTLGAPKSFLLDGRRELQIPSVEEVRQALSRKEARMAPFYTIEGLDGVILGFCALKAAPVELSYSEVLMAFADDAGYASPAAADALAFLERLAFVERPLNKIVGQCLSCETALRELFLREGFVSCGVQREVTYTGGCYHDLETFAYYRSQYQEAGASQPAPG